MTYWESNSTGAPFAAVAVLYFARAYNSQQTELRTGLQDGPEYSVVILAKGVLI